MDHRHVVLARDGEHVGIHEARMTNLEGVPQRQSARGGRQQAQKSIQFLRIKRLFRRQLPQNGSKLRLEFGDSTRDETLHRRSRASKVLALDDEPRRFDRE